MSTEKTPLPAQDAVDSLFGALDDLGDLGSDLESSLPLSPSDLSAESTGDLTNDPELLAALDEAVLGIEGDQTRVELSSPGQREFASLVRSLTEDLVAPPARTLSSPAASSSASATDALERATLVATHPQATPKPSASESSPPPGGLAPKPLFDIDRMFGSSDLVSEEVDPLITGDFGQRSVAPSGDLGTGSSEKAGSDDLMVVGRILGGNVDIVVDVSTLLDADEEEEVEEQLSFAKPEQPYDPSEDLTVMGANEPVPRAAPIAQAEPVAPERSRSIPSVPTIPAEFGTSLAVLGSIGSEAYLKKTGADVARDAVDPGEERDARREAFEDFNSGQYLLARKKFERLSKAHRQSSEYAALATYCRFKLTQGEAERLSEISKLAEYAKAYSACVTTRLYLGRMYMEMERPQGAVRYFKEALEIDSSRSDVVVELRRANDVLQVLRADRDVDPLAVDLPERPAIVRGSTVVRKKVNISRVPQAVLVFALVAGLLFYLSNVMSLGRHEQAFRPAEPFFWIRAGVLIGAGFLFAALFLRSDPLTSVDFQVPIRALIASVIVGGLIGSNMSLSIIKVPLGTVLLMSLFQVLSEEVFFRGFLGRALEAGLLGVGTPTLVGGIFFGVYQLTYSSQWNLAPTTEGLFRLAIVTFGAGVPYAFLHHRSKTLTIPFACHLTVNTVVMFASVYE